MRTLFVFAALALVGCGTSSDASDAGSDASAETGADATLDAALDVTNDAPTDSPAEANPCSGTQVLCSGKCVDLQTNHDHCGQCPVACTSAQVCASGSCVDITYNDMTQSSNWLAYDITNVDASALQGYSGGTFDGRYVYYAPESSVVLRYDTTSNAFATKASWETFDASAVSATVGMYLGAVFDGRYVYYVPGASGYSVLRYDTTLPFNAKTSYATFLPTQLGPSTKAFAGATFDGRYVYLSPWYVTPNYQSVALRYDTTASFTSTSSWEPYDLNNVGTNIGGYYGCVFDGRYVTFVPLRHANDLAEGSVVRFDTTQSTFSTQGAWSIFDTTTIDFQAYGYAGGAFDGTFLYFTPNMGHAARYDTSGAFAGDGGAWKTYSTYNVDAQIGSLALGGFDGRYVYFATASKPKIARVDTTMAFDQKGSWSEFDVSTLTPSTYFLDGMIYDGRYMYFPPGSYQKVTPRFDTKNATAMPALPQFHGSFF